MHAETLATWTHQHVFLGRQHRRNERRTWAVIVLCTAMMLAEIVGGAVFGSMALIADGMHMSTHAGALLIAALAYTCARRYARDPRFAFGTGKLGDLAAFASAIALAMIALLIGWESVQRLLRPVPIAFPEAVAVAVLGLGVNLASAWLLADGDEHEHVPHHHAHGHAGELPDHDHQHRRDRDLNLRAAYVHVLADAAVSVLALVGLLTAWQLGWRQMDPLMGIVGALVIANWSWGLVRAAGAILLDMRPEPALVEAVRERLEIGGDRVADLHLWRIGPGHLAAAITLVCGHPAPPHVYKARLGGLSSLSHVTIEVEQCPGHNALPMAA
jgi:cation diffusion facilitator family transporter